MRLVYVAFVLLLALMSSGQCQTTVFSGSSDDKTDGWAKEFHDCRFAHEKWGAYGCIDLDGKKYFGLYSPAYVNYPTLLKRSTDISLFNNGQVSEVLIDNDSEGTLSCCNPDDLILELKEGYQLHLVKVEDDGSRVYVELTRNGEVVDRKVVGSSFEEYSTPDYTGQNTYAYKNNIGKSRNIVQIAVNFKNALKTSDGSLANYEGVFQISESPKDLTSPSSEVQTVQEHDSDGKLLWEVEGYRAESDQKYKVLDRSSPSTGDPNSFIANVLRYKGSEIPICIIHDGYQLVPHGKFRSWTTGGGTVWETPVVEGEYRNGLKQGHWDFWHVGELVGIPAKKGAEGEYLNGLQEGHWKYYDSICRDMVSREGDYLNGVEQDGTWIETEYVMDQGKCVPGKSGPSAIGARRSYME